MEIVYIMCVCLCTYSQRLVISVQSNISNYDTHCVVMCVYVVYVWYSMQCNCVVDVSGMCDCRDRELALKVTFYIRTYNPQDWSTLPPLLN